MKSTLVLVGRPNVGKSTLFNRITKTRDALVADQPGLTRDRQYGLGRFLDQEFIVVDTAGFDPVAKQGILYEMAQQAEQAIAEADVLLFLVDGRAGITPHDEQIAARLRQAKKKIVVVVNKAEGFDRGIITADFYKLGLGDPIAISAAHGEGVGGLLEQILEEKPESSDIEENHLAPALKIALVGRPNVGKSTFVNALLGEQRVIAFDMPGTTRDAIHIPFERKGKSYVLVDTAGLRRKGKVFETIEKFSVIKTLQAIQDAHVVVLLLDATQHISDQDAHIAGFILESGRALVVAVNKWDAVDEYQRQQIKNELAHKLSFLSFATQHFIAAAQSKGLDAVMRSVDSAYQAAIKKLPTPKLTRVLQEALVKQMPPFHGKVRPKLRYAHQGGQNPPIIVIHGNALEYIPQFYVRYLKKTFQDAFKLQGTPVNIQFRSGKNPYIDK